MSLSVGEMRGYCYLMSTPHPLQVLVRSFLNFTDVLRMCIWFGPLSSAYFFSHFFQLVNLYLMPISDTMCIYL